MASKVLAKFIPCPSNEASAFFGKRAYKPSYEGEALSLILYIGEEPIAGGEMRKINPEAYEIVNLYVPQNLRQNRLGFYVIRFLEEKIKEIGGRLSFISCPLFLYDHLRDRGYVYAPNPEGAKGQYPYLVKRL